MRVLHVVAAGSTVGDRLTGAPWFLEARAAAGRGDPVTVLVLSADLTLGASEHTDGPGGVSLVFFGAGEGGSVDAPGLAATLRDLTLPAAPEEVHLHATGPTLVDLLDAIRELAGRRVLWVEDSSLVCARGNGVDHTGGSCALAVTPGSCACAGGTSALARRNAVLRDAVAGIDEIRAPSAEAAARLAASGLAATLVPPAPGAPIEAVSPGPRAADRAGGPLHEVLLIAGVTRGAPLHYRVHQKVEQLRLHGVRSTVRGFTDPRLAEDAHRADAVIVYRAPATPDLMQVVEAARKRGTPTFYDVDDLIFDPDAVAELPIHRGRSQRELGIWVENAHRCQAVLRACGRGIVSTAELARHMERLGIPVEVHPNGIDTVLSVLSESARRMRSPVPAGLTLAYCSGTDTHDADLALVSDVLAEFLASERRARLVLGGPLQVPRALRRSRRVERRGLVGRSPFVHWFAGFDLNLAPLVEHTFTECKSSIKWSEAALVEVPTLASATEPFRASIDQHRTGLLAGTAEEFLGQLRWAAADLERLRGVGRAARREAYVAGSPWRLGASLVRILTSPTDTRVVAASTPARPWPSEIDAPNVEPAGLLGGEFAIRPRPRPAQPLAAGPVVFALPDSSGMGRLRYAEVMVATWTQAAAGPVELVARSGRDDVDVATATPPFIRDNLWAPFEFEHGVLAGPDLTLELRSAGGDNVGPYVMPQGARLVDGQPRRGVVVAKVWYEPPVPPDPVPRLVAPNAGGRTDVLLGRLRWLGGSWVGKARATASALRHRGRRPRS